MRVDFGGAGDFWVAGASVRTALRAAFRSALQGRDLSRPYYSEQMAKTDMQQMAKTTPHSGKS